jgi:hypothetical protein
LSSGAVVRADLATLYRVWEGEIDLLDAVRGGEAQISGTRPIVSQLPEWLALSPVVPYVRAARAGA